MVTKFGLAIGPALDGVVQGPPKRYPPKLVAPGPVLKYLTGDGTLGFVWNVGEVVI